MSIVVTTTSKTRLKRPVLDKEAIDTAARSAIEQAGGQAVRFRNVHEHIAPDTYEGDIQYEYDWEFDTRDLAF